MTIDLHPRKSTGAPPDWFADHLYVLAYTTVTGISEEENYPIREDIELFAPTIVHQQKTFTIDLNGIASIVVEIHNAAGSLVKQFTCEPKRQRYQITWYCDDNSGNRLPTGVYFLRLQAGNHCAAEKLLLIR